MFWHWPVSPLKIYILAIWGAGVLNLSSPRGGVDYYFCEIFGKNNTASSVNCVPEVVGIKGNVCPQGGGGGKLVCPKYGVV